MTTSEKVAYLKGLAEGMEIDKDAKEGKLIGVIIDILEDMALDIEDLGENVLEFSEALDAISDDLAEVEEVVFEDEDDCCCCDCDDDDCDCDCDCCCDDDDICEFYEVTCPSCGEPVYIDDSIDPSRVICPSCNAEFKTED